MPPKTRVGKSLFERDVAWNPTCLQNDLEGVDVASLPRDGEPWERGPLAHRLLAFDQMTPAERRANPFFQPSEGGVGFSPPQYCNLVMCMTIESANGADLWPSELSRLAADLETAGVQQDAASATGLRAANFSVSERSLKSAVRCAVEPAPGVILTVNLARTGHAVLSGKGSMRDAGEAFNILLRALRRIVPSATPKQGSARVMNIVAKMRAALPVDGAALGAAVPGLSYNSDAASFKRTVSGRMLGTTLRVFCDGQVISNGSKSAASLLRFWWAFEPILRRFATAGAPPTAMPRAAPLPRRRPRAHSGDVPTAKVGTGPVVPMPATLAAGALLSVEERDSIAGLAHGDGYA